MVIICAILFGSFTIETCVTLKRAIARVQDKEIDEIKNLHLIKHWVEPDLIPFGWGHDRNDYGNNENNIDQAILKDDDVYSGNPHLIRVLKIDSLRIEEVGSEDDEISYVEQRAQIEAHSEANSEVFQNSTESIPKDIFDESLRYSDVNRPKLSVITSAPLPPRRGSFEDPNEKIANLFNIKRPRT